MKIGIDIDDTTVIMVNAMLKYAEIFDTQVLGRKGSNGKLGLIQSRYYLEALYGWNHEEKYRFFDTYYKNVLEECEPMKNVAETIQKLKNEGNEIFFITARLGRNSKLRHRKYHNKNVTRKQNSLRQIDYWRF